MIGRIAETATACLLVSLAALLGGCGGGSDGGGVFGGTDSSVPGPPPPPETVTFWATDLSTGTDYQLQADKVGEGTRCRVYLENGRTVPQATIGAIVNGFDGTIYPRTTGAFGSEPNPGIDNDAKIAILLLDIRDGYTPGGGYVAGYFDPVNQFLQAELPVGYHSNEREMFYMDIDPGTAGDPQFVRTLSHEFQHMIHFNEESASKGGLGDDIWLNEAMSLVAPVYSGYGPDYLRVDLFEGEPWNALTRWDDRLEDYGVAYMWAQYVKDRVDPATGSSVFWRMLHRPETGIASVNAALAEIGYGKDFRGVFRDWAVANYSGNALAWPGHPEWSYTTINTWPGTYPAGGDYSIAIPGLFADPLRTNVGAFPVRTGWSTDYYVFTPQSGSTGAVTWTAASGLEWASLGDNATLSFNLASGVPCSYAGAGYLAIVTEPAGDSGGGIIVTTGGGGIAEKLGKARGNAAARRFVAATGRPVPVCVHPFLKEKAGPVLGKRIRPSR